jgi:WD40 repeat protein
MEMVLNEFFLHVTIFFLLLSSMLERLVCTYFLPPFLPSTTNFMVYNPKVNKTMIIVMNDREIKQQYFMFIDTVKSKSIKHKPKFPFYSVYSFSRVSSTDGGISQVKLREAFSLLLSDVEGQKQQTSGENLLKPQLLNSYRGHTKSITGLLFFEKNQVLITSSVDKSVRLWNLSGQVRSVWVRCE